MQNEGKENRSTMENLIIINAISNSDETVNYLLYADAGECFDKLKLNDKDGKNRAWSKMI